jgi:hypothetical protein
MVRAATLGDEGPFRSSGHSDPKLVSEVPLGWGCGPRVACYARLPRAIPTAGPRRISMRLGISSHGRARGPCAPALGPPSRRARAPRRASGLRAVPRGPAGAHARAPGAMSMRLCMARLGASSPPRVRSVHRVGAALRPVAGSARPLHGPVGALMCLGARASPSEGGAQGP